MIKSVFKDGTGIIYDDADGNVWTAELVKKELNLMVKVVRATTGTTLPAGYGSNMPDYIPDFSDLVTRDQDEEKMLLDEAQNRYTPTTIEISRANRSLAWQSQYLNKHPRRAGILKMWLKNQKRGAFKRAIERKGQSERTVYRRLDQSVQTIANGLNIDRVPVKIPHIGDLK